MAFKQRSNKPRSEATPFPHTALASLKRRGPAAIFAATTAIVCLATPIHAAVFQWVNVGDAGNAADTVVNYDGTSGYGAVAYDYKIGKYEVTNDQYVEFLNAKDPTGANTLQLYDFHMSTNLNFAGINFDVNAAVGSRYSVKPGLGNRPVDYVDAFAAMRFANWVNNGQGSGDTETGAYTLLGGTPIPTNALTITRNVGASVFLPNENEWYKAAYYKGGGTDAGYWYYATQSDVMPISDQPPGLISNAANYLNNDGLNNGYNDGYAVTGFVGLVF